MLPKVVLDSDTHILKTLSFQQLFFLGIIHKLKHSIGRNALNQMYMSYLLPIAEYASVVWDGCSEQDSQTLQKIKNEAAHIITGLTRSVSLENLYKNVDELYHKEGSNINSLSCIMLKLAWCLHMYNT